MNKLDEAILEARTKLHSTLSIWSMFGKLVHEQQDHYDMLIAMKADGDDMKYETHAIERDKKELADFIEKRTLYNKLGGKHE